jgi:hypothetical protein
LILQEGIRRIGPHHFEAFGAPEFCRKPQVVQHGREKEEFLIVAQALRLPDQGAEDERPEHVMPNYGRRDPKGQIYGLLRQNAVGESDARDLPRQRDLSGHDALPAG